MGEGGEDKNPSNSNQIHNKNNETLGDILWVFFFCSTQFIIDKRKTEYDLRIFSDEFKASRFDFPILNGHNLIVIKQNRFWKNNKQMHLG